MAIYSIFPLSPEYTKQSNAVLKKLEERDPVDQAEDTTKAIKLFINDISVFMMGGLVGKSQINEDSRRAVIQVTRVVKKMVNLLLQKVFIKLDNKQLHQVVLFYKKREIEVGGTFFLGIQFDEIMEGHLTELIDSYNKNDIDAARKLCILLSINAWRIILDVYINETLSLIKLGSLGRKVVHTTLTTIEKVIPSRTEIYFNNLSDEDFDDAYQFLVSTLIER